MGGYGDENIYYSTPEPWSIIAEGEWGGGYEFDTLLIFQNRETGELRMAHDAGCSCPTPFEDYDTINDAPLLTSIKALDEYISGEKYFHERYEPFDEFKATDPQYNEIIATVHRALRDGVPA